MAKVLKTTIKLRRDTINNYASYPDHIPLSGEVCIVDPTNTSPWAKAKSIRIKIGDGKTAWKDLKFYDEMNSSVLLGYYSNGKFYLDINHTQELEALEVTVLYVDLHSGVIYYYNGEQLVASKVDLPRASDSAPGVMKLYQTLGQNTDGTMSQKAITDSIAAIRLVVDENDNSAFCLVGPEIN